MSACQKFSSDCFNYLYADAHLSHKTHFRSLSFGLCNYVVKYPLLKILRQIKRISGFLPQNADIAPTSSCYLKLCITCWLLNYVTDMYKIIQSIHLQGGNANSLSVNHKLCNEVHRMVFNSFRASAEADKMVWWMWTSCNELHLYHTSKFIIQPFNH